MLSFGTGRVNGVGTAMIAAVRLMMSEVASSSSVSMKYVFFSSSLFPSKKGDHGTSGRAPAAARRWFQRPHCSTLFTYVRGL